MSSYEIACHYGIDILSDVWMWTFNDGWTAILIEGLQLPRFSGLAFYYENQLHFIGGYPSYKSYLFDIDVDFTHYVLDVTCSNIESHRPLKWQLLITNETASVGCSCSKSCLFDILISNRDPWILNLFLKIFDGPQRLSVTIFIIITNHYLSWRYFLYVGNQEFWSKFVHLWLLFFEWMIGS